MARKKSPNLTDSELRLMEVIWQKGSATVAEVADGLPKSLNLAYNTTLRILERKGYLRHTTAKDSRAFIYTPLVSREQASRTAVGLLLGRFFGGSAKALVLNLIEDERLNDAELKRVRELLKEETE